MMFPQIVAATLCAGLVPAMAAAQTPDPARAAFDVAGGTVMAFAVPR